jgi:hypothetical protein
VRSTGNGSSIANTTIALEVGWNLVGFTSFAADFSVSSLKAQVPVLRVEAFSAADAPHHLKVLGDADLFSGGNGYWVRADADGIVTIAS